ncbi:helix-turn-helix transcriptional regulator [Haloplanus sp. GCM10025708]|uniref:helix-turn-helix transcriptional regulator n=1 Tax=Haloplanus sp. GCM10025708 TaxID=3252679 RepID=UPI00360DC7CB
MTEPSTDGDATASADAGPSEAEPEPAEPDVSLLSDEERVEHLLERNGGRMKQAQIVRETGWSDAKVSQLLSSMAEEDRVEKLRLGRENLISLPDEE